jgi:hypothetical protein
MHPSAQIPAASWPKGEVEMIRDQAIRQDAKNAKKTIQKF